MSGFILLEYRTDRTARVGLVVTIQDYEKYSFSEPNKHKTINSAILNDALNVSNINVHYDTDSFNSGDKLMILSPSVSPMRSHIRRHIFRING